MIQEKKERGMLLCSECGFVLYVNGGKRWMEGRSVTL